MPEFLDHAGCYVRAVYNRIFWLLYGPHMSDSWLIKYVCYSPPVHPPGIDNIPWPAEVNWPILKYPQNVPVPALLIFGFYIFKNYRLMQSY